MTVAEWQAWQAYPIAGAGVLFLLWLLLLRRR